MAYPTVPGRTSRDLVFQNADSGAAGTRVYDETQAAGLAAAKAAMALADSRTAQTVTHPVLPEPAGLDSRAKGGAA